MEGSQSSGVSSAHQVKSFGEVHEGEEQWLLLLSALLLQLTEGEDHVHCGPSGSEATLWLEVNLRSKALQAGQGDPDFANDAQKRDATIVVAITTVTLVLVQGDYVGISHVLGDVTLLPAQAEEHMKWLQDGLIPMPQNVRRDTVLSRCLATGETVDGYAELFQCRRVVKLLYDWQPRQGIEGSVCDDVLG